MFSFNFVHRLLAVPILFFIAIHLLNHIVSIAGVESHIAFMDVFRGIYRNSYVEVALLFFLSVQISIGLYFVFRAKNKRQGFFAKAQALSGLYIAFFVFFHVGAVLHGRYNLGLDTNFYFASAGMHINQLDLFFIPYYFFSVVAVFTHVACFIHRRISNVSIDRANMAAGIVMILGGLVGTLIVAALGGVFYDINIPSEYKSMF